LYGLDDGAGPGSPGPYCSQLTVLVLLPESLSLLLDRPTHVAVFDVRVVVALMVPWTPDVGVAYTVVYSVMYTHSIGSWLLWARPEGGTYGHETVSEACAAAPTVVRAP
jgi:hypothetical protein